MSLSVGGEPVKAPSKHTLYRRTHPPPGNHQLTHTHSRGSGRTGETLATESLPKTAAPAQSPVRGSPRFTEPTPPGWTNFSRSSSPRSASWCPRERRCLKVRAAAFTSDGIPSFARAPLNRERERRVIRCLFWSLA